MSHPRASAKVPQITLGFWVIKIFATTLGETGGDAVTMSMHAGYLVGTLLFATLFAIAVSVQLRARQFHPFVYWAVIVASTTVGTTLADFADRSIGIGYSGGSLLLGSLLLITLATWHRVTGTIAVSSVASRRAETFYWVAIMLSQTLGTALGDWLASSGLGYRGGAMVCAGALVVVAVAYTATRLPRTALFWAAFIITRPLGATLGDLLDKPIHSGGLALDRLAASAILAAVIAAAVIILPQRAQTSLPT